MCSNKQTWSVISLVILLFTCCTNKDSLLERTKQNFLSDIDKAFPYLNDIVITDTTITNIADKLCFIDFTLTGNDSDGNTLTGKWSYRRSNLLGVDSVDNVFIQLREKDALLSQSYLLNFL